MYYERNYHGEMRAEVERVTWAKLFRNFGPQSYTDFLFTLRSVSARY